MDLRRVLRDFNDLGRALVDSDAPEPPNDEADGYELAVSARDFTDATRKVVDEKLTFSAALLRAGELDEAQKILAEVEHDVRNEEAALLEKVNEVSAKRAVGRSHITRLRLARMLATAMVGAGLLGVSAMGMAVAGMFEDRNQPRHNKDRGRHVRVASANRDAVKQVVIGGVKMKLSKQDLETFRRLTSGSVDATTLERFLVADLELPRAVVDHTLASVLSLADPVRTEVNKAVETTVAAAEETTALLGETTKKIQKPKAKTTEVKKPTTTEEEPPPPPEEEETPTTEAEKDDKDDRGDGDGDGQKTGLPGIEKL